MIKHLSKDNIELASEEEISKEDLVKRTSVKDIGTLKPDDISAMDKKTILANIRHWIYHYKNTPKRDNKKILRNSALMCVNYMSNYSIERVYYSAYRLYKIIKKNQITNFIDLFNRNEQYASSLYWLFKKQESRFENALLSTQPNKKMSILFSEYFEDTELKDDDVAKYNFRVKKGLIHLLEPMNTKEISEKYDIVLCEKYKTDKQLVLSIKLPSEYYKTIYKKEVTIDLTNGIREQWKNIYTGIKKMRTRNNKQLGIEDKINIVFDRAKNTKDNSVIYINFIKYISWLYRGEIYISTK